MRILLCAINYAPEKSGNAPYTTGLAEHLAAHGHEVHVLAGMPHYPEWRQMDLPERQASALNGVRIHRRRHYIPEHQSTAQRALYEASFLGSASSMRGLPKPDIAIGIVPTLSNAALARLAATRYRVPYGLLFQDLMGRAAGQSGIGCGSAVESLIQKGEGWLARGASRVAIVSEGFRPYLVSLGVAPRAICRVRNWSHLPLPAGNAAATRGGFGWPDDEVICLHAGNMGYKQGLDNVIEAARLAAVSNPELRFVFIGQGSQSEAMKLKAQSCGLSNVQFLPPQADQAYMDALAAADVLLLSLNPRVTDMAFPSKLASYVISGRPIVASVAAASEVGKELVAHKAALMIEPGRPEYLLEGIAQLASDDLLAKRLIRAAKRYSPAFGRETALAELERFVLEVAGRQPGTDEGRAKEIA